MVNTTDFLTIGDLHLNGLNNKFPNYSFDPNDLIFKALEKPIEYAYENGIDKVILLGDIYDHPEPSQELQVRFLTFLANHSKLQFYCIAGNHDYLNNETLSLQISNFVTNISNKYNHVKFYTKPKLEWIDGVPFSFLPWPACKTKHNPSVNIAHVEISGSKTDNGKTIDNGYKISKNGYWLIGHLHQRQEYINKQVFYPGNLFQKTFGERLPKGFYHVSAEYKKGVLSVEHEFIPIQPPFRFINLKIEKPDDLKQIKKPDPNRIIQYKIMIRNGIELPIGFAANYPNVIDIAGKLSVKELSSMEKNDYKTDLIDVDIDYLYGLDEILINDGLSAKQLTIAHKIVDRYLERR